MLAVSTGVDSFVKPEDLGPLYPFVGLEFVFFGVALFLWLAWHFLQARGETKENREACEMYDEIGLDRAMYHGGSALMPTDEEWAGRSGHDGQAGARPVTGPETAERPHHGDSA